MCFSSADSETISSFSELSTKENSAELVLNYVSESCTQSRASHAVCMSLCTCMSVSICPFFPDIFYSCSLPLATLAYQSDFLLLSFQGN